MTDQTTPGGPDEQVGSPLADPAQEGAAADADPTATSERTDPDDTEGSLREATQRSRDPQG